MCDDHVKYSIRHVKLDKKRKSLAWVPQKPRDRHFTVNYLPREICETFWALLMVLGSRSRHRNTQPVVYMRDAPREAFLARFASSDTCEALSIFTCCVLYMWIQSVSITACSKLKPCVSGLQLCLMHARHMVRWTKIVWVHVMYMWCACSVHVKNIEHQCLFKIISCVFSLWITACHG